MTEQVNDLHKANHIQNKSKSFTLVPDKWSRMYCSEYFNAFEYRVWNSHEIKKVGEILAKPAPKKEKLSPLKHFIW